MSVRSSCPKGWTHRFWVKVTFRPFSRSGSNTTKWCLANRSFVPAQCSWRGQNRADRVTDMKRRDLLKGSLAAGAAVALPSRLFAQWNPTATRDAKLMDIAREELARVGGNIWRKDIVAIADFGLHSARRRFHFVDLENERVASYHVSHGTLSLIHI